MDNHNGDSMGAVAYMVGMEDIHKGDMQEGEEGSTLRIAEACVGTYSKTSMPLVTDWHY